MKFVILILVGAVSGILGGMGMGGGTLLIPLLTLLLGFNQKGAQVVNLISFSVMAIFVLILHTKNKLVNFKVAIIFVGFSLITTILGAMLANVIKSHYLKIFYGMLLIVIAIYQTVLEFKEVFKNKQKNR